MSHSGGGDSRCSHGHIYIICRFPPPPILLPPTPPLQRGAQDGHLDFHTAPSSGPRMLVECCFTSTKTVGLLGSGAQDVHLDFQTAPKLWPEDVPLVEFMYLACPERVTDSGLWCHCVCVTFFERWLAPLLYWFSIGALGFVLFQTGLTQEVILPSCTGHSYPRPPPPPPPQKKKWISSPSYFSSFCTV